MVCLSFCDSVCNSVSVSLCTSDALMFRQLIVIVLSIYCVFMLSPPQGILAGCSLLSSELDNVYTKVRFKINIRTLKHSAHICATVLRTSFDSSVCLECLSRTPGRSTT